MIQQFDSGSIWKATALDHGADQTQGCEPIPLVGLSTIALNSWRAIAHIGFQKGGTTMSIIAYAGGSFQPD